MNKAWLEACVEGLYVQRAGWCGRSSLGEGSFIMLENNFLGSVFEVELITKSSCKGL